LTELVLADLTILKTIIRKGNKIHFIDEQSIDMILNSGIYASCYMPLGLFIYAYGEGRFCAVDNSDCNAWTEDFNSEYAAIRFLIDENFDLEKYNARVQKKQVV